MNNVNLIGRLTRDVDIRYTQTNNAMVAQFSIAIDRPFAAKDNEERQTDFINIVAWRQQAEFVAKYFTKGRMAVVEGRLQIRDWQDRDGNKRRSAEVIADNVYFGDSRRDSSGDSGSDAQIGNRHGDSWIYIPGHGRFTYDEVENYVNSGKVIETYDSATNTYTYKWNGNKK